MKPQPVTLVELCAGTAAVSLWALGRASPLTGYMGSKRRWAADLVDMLDADRPARVVLVDAGPWGDTWRTLRDPEARREVAAWFDRLDGEYTPNGLWSTLVACRPFEDPIERAVQYLWLQARSAGTIPIWWNHARERWERHSARRPSQVDATKEHAIDPERRYATGGRGIQYPSTIAERVRALDAIDWSRVEVVVGDVREVEPIRGARVLFDPPYLGAPRYAEVCPRSDVLDVAQRWASAGARVVVCEAEALPLAGWHARPLRSVRGSREVVTCNWRPAGEQLVLGVA